MTGKRYYLATFDAWRRSAASCAESHYVVTDTFAKNAAGSISENAANRQAAQNSGRGTVLALISADEATHIVLENDPEFEALPHPLSRKPISERAAAALASFGVVQGDDTFTAAEKLAAFHPLLKHRVF